MLRLLSLPICRKRRYQVVSRALNARINDFPRRGLVPSPALSVRLSVCLSVCLCLGCCMTGLKKRFEPLDAVDSLCCFVYMCETAMADRLLLPRKHGIITAACGAAMQHPRGSAEFRDWIRFHPLADYNILSGSIRLAWSQLVWGCYTYLRHSTQTK